VPKSRISKPDRTSSLSAVTTLEGDAIDSPVRFLSEQEAAVGGDENAHGASPRFRNFRLDQKAGDEILVMPQGSTLLVKRHKDNLVAGAAVTIPGATKRDERAVSISLGESITVVERQAQSSRMCLEENLRRYRLSCQIRP